ncbi:hypothetical protein ACNTMW_22320 [Planosporangium sp. 12N6]|uniref:hypothetical protein n=1 Tax=Planosporangium spinosum TaxID=3402278 RepID=UPI003CEE455B
MELTVAGDAVRVAGLDLGHDSVEAAEHWLHELVHRLGHPAGLIACTHLVYEPHPHVAVSFAAPVPGSGAPLGTSGAQDPWPPDAVGTAGARRAAAEHTARTGGRAVHYPGVELLTGSLPVGEVIGRSAIERVVMLGGVEAAPETVLHTLDYVRPVWRDGRLTLVTRPAPEGTLAPFELRNPTPCCADR